jgi:hypothetical protein
MLAATKQCSRGAARPVVRCAAQETRPLSGASNFRLECILKLTLRSPAVALFHLISIKFASFVGAADEDGSDVRRPRAASGERAAIARCKRS